MVDTKNNDRVTTIAQMQIGKFGIISNEAIGGRHLVFRCHRENDTNVNQFALVFGALGRNSDETAPYIVRADADYWGDEVVVEVADLELQTDLDKVRMTTSSFGRLDHLCSVFQTGEIKYFQSLGLGVGSAGPRVSLTGELLEESIHGPTVAFLNWSLVRNGSHDPAAIDIIYSWRGK